MWETETDDEEEVGMDQVKELVFDLVVEFFHRYSLRSRSTNQVRSSLMMMITR